MKIIILLLCAGNLAAFGWLYTHRADYQPQQTAQVNQLPPNIEKLLLLSERVESEPVSTPVKQGQDKAAPATAAEESSAEPIAETGPSTPEDQVDDAPTAAAATPEPGDVPEQPQPQPPARLCQTIGPFITQANIDTLVSELKDLDIVAEQRTVQLQEPSGFWVYLPAMPNDEARRIVDELADKGVKDYFLGRQNFISLGIFSDLRTAEARMQEITALGYDARLEPRYQTREVYWLDLEEQGDRLISDNRWQALLGQRADIRRQTVACE
ncbi:MAG: hypothetical protein KKA36_06010 [Gammaproteobacteria bacterium]|nr:hypothetical protein [Gammaproteobacteria bacterium]